MADLLFSNKAVEDLTNICNYTVETWSEAQADKYYALSSIALFNATTLFSCSSKSRRPARTTSLALL